MATPPAGHLSVEACLALREMGYPQDGKGHWYNDIQYAWEGGERVYAWFLNLSDHRPIPPPVGAVRDSVFYPDALTAMEWLEQRYDLLIERVHVSSNVEDWPVRYSAEQRYPAQRLSDGEMDDILWAANPSDLIIAISSSRIRPSPQ